MKPYAGRFAPTPSGPLHFGSLVTALGSWLAARAAGGRWLLRIDDLDRPRVQPGAESTIRQQLENYGLWWDASPRRQSEHLAEYAEALQRLEREGYLYACICTRAQLRQAATDDADSGYPGTCRAAGHPARDAALRVRVDRLAATAAAHGDGADEAGAGGDFIVRRRDGQIAYQLACAVDEAAQGITHVVRGADLVASSHRQRLLMAALDLPVPAYLHLPLVVAADGHKLSKQNHARPVDGRDVVGDLRRALRILGQPDPGHAGNAASLLAAATAAWNPARIPTAPVMLS